MENKQLEQVEKTEEVIVAENVGVYFDTRISQDDYKSRLLSLFSRKSKEEKKQPRKVWPLKDISFKGHKGEILGIIGANGAGKTTLSKVITGILKHDKGYLHVDGKVTALFSFGMGFNTASSPIPRSGPRLGFGNNGGFGRVIPQGRATPGRQRL